MSRPCYRCSAIIQEQTTFCPSCRAPQIRVVAPPAEAEEGAREPETETADESAFASSVGRSPAPSRPPGFLKTALPFAIPCGLMCGLIPPLGMVMLAVCTALCINRYRKNLGVDLTRGQGAKLGALLGLLSFPFFQLVYVVQMVANFEETRKELAERMHALTAQNPDPALQQFSQWITTNQGFITIVVFAALLFLCVLLLLGAGSGALATFLQVRKDRR